jgi:alcohol dehydrogenase
MADSHRSHTEAHGMDITRTYTLCMAPRIVFGVGTVQQVGTEASRLGISRALVVTDNGLAQTDIPGLVTAQLDAAGVAWTLFGEVEPNPSVGTVQKGLGIYTREGCDGLVAVGGGSPMDAAKAIGLLAANGSEVTQFTVITDTEKKFKMGIGSPYNIPRVAVVDPSLLAKLPGRLVASTGMDALCHAVESYTSQAAQPVSDAFNIQAIRMIGQHLRPAVANGNLSDLSGMAMASMLAGLGFNNTRTTLVHAMSHAVTGHAQVPHGIANAILLPFGMEFNLMGSPQRHADIAAALGESIHDLSAMEAARLAVDAVRELAADVGIPRNLREVGVTEGMIDPLADGAMQAVLGIALNPRRPNRQEVAALYRKALG